MYLKHISNDAIKDFVKTKFSHDAHTIVVEDCRKRNYINLLTNLVDITLHCTDFECFNIDLDGKGYHKIWRDFMLKQLDIIDTRLGDKYILDLQKHIESCDICTYSR